MVVDPTSRCSNKVVIVCVYLLLTGILKQWPQSFKVGWCGDNDLEVLRNFQSRKIIVHIVYESFPVKLIDNSELKIPIIITLL